MPRTRGTNGSRIGAAIWTIAPSGYCKRSGFSYTFRMSANADPQLLFASIYDELKRLAHAQLDARGPRTLGTTALVHEAYIKLVRGDVAVQDRQHFVSLVVRAMRQILVDAARGKMADKRGNNPALITLGAAHEEASAAISVDVLALEQAIDRLRGLHARLASVVEMHFYGGLSFVEISELIGVTERTVQRDWMAARVLLERDLESLG
jgi:RNA polymerase sigma factor (TIGR02999 family)